MILSSTDGHPSRYNDKTLVFDDAFARDIKEGNILNDVEFELMERTQDNEIIFVKYKGAWCISDNGYLKWSKTIPPFKNTSIRSEIKWSDWLESMRKNVECTFGILNG